MHRSGVILRYPLVEKVRCVECGGEFSDGVRILGLGSHFEVLENQTPVQASKTI